jgi:hypothetical protein
MCGFRMESTRGACMALQVATRMRCCSSLFYSGRQHLFVGSVWRHVSVYQRIFDGLCVILANILEQCFLLFFWWGAGSIVLMLWLD